MLLDYHVGVARADDLFGPYERYVHPCAFNLFCHVTGHYREKTISIWNRRFDGEYFLHTDYERYDAGQARRNNGPVTFQ